MQQLISMPSTTYWLLCILCTILCKYVSTFGIWQKFQYVAFWDIPTVLSCRLHILCAVYCVHTAYFTVVVVVLYSKHSRLLITALNRSLLLIWVWLRWSGLKALTCIVLHDQLHAWCVNLCLSLHFPFTGIIHFSLHAFLGKRHLKGCGTISNLSFDPSSLYCYSVLSLLSLLCHFHMKSLYADC